MLGCALLALIALVRPSAASDLEFGYSCLEPQITIFKNDLPERFRTEGIMPSAAVLIPIGTSAPLWSGSSFGQCFAVIREDGTLEPILGPFTSGSVGWPWDPGPLLVVWDETDPFRGRWPGPHGEHHGEGSLFRMIRRGAIWEHPLDVLGTQDGRLAVSDDQLLAFGGSSDERTAVIVRLDATMPTVLKTFSLGALECDSYGDLYPVQCDALFHEGGLFVMQQSWTGKTWETSLLHFALGEQGIQETLRTEPIFDMCYLLAASQRGCYVAVECQGRSGAMILLAEQYGRDRGLAVGHGASVQGHGTLRRRQSDRFIECSSRAVTSWRLDDGEGAVRQWSVDLKTERDVRPIAPTGDGRFILAETEDGRWVVFRDGVPLIPDVAALPRHEHTGRDVWVHECGDAGGHALLIRGAFRDGVQNRFQVDLLE